jgi:hypothetical protein
MEMYYFDCQTSGHCISTFTIIAITNAHCRPSCDGGYWNTSDIPDSAVIGQTNLYLRVLLFIYLSKFK